MINIYRQMWNSYFKQNKSADIQSCVSSKWSLATNSGSCRFQISVLIFPITQVSTSDENIVALLLPFMGLLESMEPLTMAPSQGDPLRLHDWWQVCFRYVPPSAFLEHTSSTPSILLPAVPVPCPFGTSLIFKNFGMERMRLTFWQRIMSFTEVSLQGKHSSVESACSKTFL